MIRIYFAGPLFTSYERKFIDECALKLRNEGFEVFVPHEQGQNRTPEEAARFASLSLREKAIEIFDIDYEGVCWANVMIALLDGTQVDDGTASEIGMFTEQILAGQDKLAIFGLADDQRVRPGTADGEGKGLNFYTVGCIYKAGGHVYGTIEEIIAELKKLQSN